MSVAHAKQVALRMASALRAAPQNYRVSVWSASSANFICIIQSLVHCFVSSVPLPIAQTCIWSMQKCKHVVQHIMHILHTIIISNMLSQAALAVLDTWTPNYQLSLPVVWKRQAAHFLVDHPIVPEIWSLRAANVTLRAVDRVLCTLKDPLRKKQKSWNWSRWSPQRWCGLV